MKITVPYWLNIMPPAPRIRIGTPEDDAKAIASDWQAVGGDIQRAMDQWDYEHPAPESLPRPMKGEG